MTRQLDTAELEHYAGNLHREIIFAELDFVSGALYVHNTGLGVIPWGGHDWLGLGEFGGISAIDESSDMGVQGFTLTLSGVEPALLASALDRTDYKGRDVALYVGVVDEDYQLLAPPKLATRGFMDVPTITREDGVGTISMHCERESVRLTRKLTTRISKEDHQLRHPGDTILDDMAALINKDVMWGGQRVAPRSDSNPRGGADERYETP